MAKNTNTEIFWKFKFQESFGILSACLLKDPGSKSLCVIVKVRDVKSN